MVTPSVFTLDSRGNSAARQLLTNPYGWWQPARFPRPARQPSGGLPASGSGAEAESISCTARAGFEEHVTGMRPP